MELGAAPPRANPRVSPEPPPVSSQLACPPNLSLARASRLTSKSRWGQMGLPCLPPRPPPPLPLQPPPSGLVISKMAPLDLDKYVEIARLCKYLPENDLKVSPAGAVALLTGLTPSGTGALSGPPFSPRDPRQHPVPSQWRA